MPNDDLVTITVRIRAEDDETMTAWGKKIGNGRQKNALCREAIKKFAAHLRRLEEDATPPEDLRID